MRVVAIVLTVSLGWMGAAKASATRCWIDQGAVVVAASFGDIAGDFIVDVGAPVSQLHVTRANEDGIEGWTVTRPLILAGHRLASAQLAVADLDALPQTTTSIAGVIGADILARYPVTIAFAPCRLTWGAADRPRRSMHLPLTLRGGVPTVSTSISDGANTRRDPMDVSTGRAEILVPNAALSRVPESGSTPAVRLRAVVVGGVLLEQVPAGTTGAGSGSIGTGVWQNWRVLRIEWKTRRLELGDAPS